MLRGDVNRVVVGHHTNIQDNAVCHVNVPAPCVVGNYVTVGHGAILYGCMVRDEVLIGMGAILMDGVVVGEQSIIGAAALLTGGLQVPPRSLVYGAPDKVISKLGEKEVAQIRHWAEEYCEFWPRNCGAKLVTVTLEQASVRSANCGYGFDRPPVCGSVRRSPREVPARKPL